EAGQIYTGKALVTPGEIEASCKGKITAAQNKKDGVGTLEVKNGNEPLVTRSFDLDVTGSEEGVVNVKIEAAAGGGGDATTASGSASFFASTEEPAKKC